MCQHKVQFHTKYEDAQMYSITFSMYTGIHVIAYPGSL